MKDGKYGMLSGLGGGEVVKSFSYDSIIPADTCYEFTIRKGNQEWLLSKQSNDPAEP